LEKFTFFYHTSSPFSQWYEGAPFSKYGILFKTAENFMMWRKGMLFGASQKVLDKIIQASAREAKQIGREEIENFNAAIWNVAARPLVAEGNYAKFSQNPDALAALLRTEGTTLVEASPTDRIWGIGLKEDDPRAQSRKTWLGWNWLGEVETDVRDTFLRVKQGY
jgi:ribA/ribD-fused uncharacterized protein